MTETFPHRKEAAANIAAIARGASISLNNASILSAPETWSKVQDICRALDQLIKDLKED